MVYDNLFRFRHLRYPQLSIKSPKYIVIFRNKITNKQYIYGINILPSEQELESSLLVKRIYENEGDNLLFSNFNNNNYEIKIEKR
jgi:hypothetical protein